MAMGGVHVCVRVGGCMEWKEGVKGETKGPVVMMQSLWNSVTDSVACPFL